MQVKRRKASHFRWNYHGLEAVTFQFILGLYQSRFPSFQTVFHLPIFFFSFRPTWLSVFSPLVSPRVTGMRARWKIQIKPLKGTNEGVAQT